MLSKKQELTQLIFVYNANSGKVNTYLDAFHKVFKPASYSCNLCAITYGVFTENKTWKNFRKRIEVPMEFLHIDEFKKQYASKFSQKFDFPIILGVTAKDWEVVVDASTLNELNSAEALIELLDKEI